VLKRCLPGRMYWPTGLRYATFQLDDGVSFVHLASNDTEHGPSPLATSQGLLQKGSSPADGR
jgi:hypothetical protein